MISSIAQPPASTTGWNGTGWVAMVKGVGIRGPALAVVLVLNFLAVLVLCRNIFSVPSLIVTFLLPGTPSWSKDLRDVDSIVGSSAKVTSSDATRFPTLFAYIEV